MSPFSYDSVMTQVVNIADPGADATMPIWKVPSRTSKAEILSAFAVCDTTISLGVGTAFTLRLYDLGTAGTAISGTVSAALGAAGTGDWTANVPRAFTISEGTIEASHYLGVVYDETGTVAPKNIRIWWEYVNGIGA